MTSFRADIHTLHHNRMRLLIWPREHGAWGMLLVPLVTGASIALRVGQDIFSLVLFGLAALALFCLRTPFEIWLKSSPLRPQTQLEQRAIRDAAIFYSFAAGVTLSILLWRERTSGLLILGAAVAGIFLVQAMLKKLGRETRMNAQLMGCLGLTSAAARAYYVVTGRLDLRALILWAANWLFAANQIHFVHVRIHAARASTRAEKLSRGKVFLIGQALTGLLLGMTWRFGGLPGPATLAFLPILFRGFAWFTRRSTPLDIHTLGLSELTHAAIFGVLFILGFYLNVE